MVGKTAKRVVYAAIVFAAIAAIILLIGSLPNPFALFFLAAGMLCFFIVIILTIIALCVHQRDQAQTQNRY